MIMDGNSRIRNTGIAEVFSRMHIVEAWGTGIQRMIEGYRSYQIAPPVFEESGSSFRVVFMRHENVQDNVRDNVQEKMARKLIEHNTFLHCLQNIRR